MSSPSPNPEISSQRAARTSWTRFGAARLVAVALLLLLAWKGREVFLLLFAGVLLSLLLSAFTDLVSRHTHLKRKAAFPLVLLLLASVVTGAVWLAAPSVKRLYVEDRLGETLEEPSADQRELRTEAI